MTLARPALALRLSGLLRLGAASWAPPPPAGVRRAVVDYSSPNIAKEMHVGHLRSTILGEALANALAFCGVAVLRLNHVGDWGTQFGMLIEHLADQGGAAEGASVGDLQAFYKASKRRFDEDADFKARAQAAVVRLQAGGEEETQHWAALCEVSRTEFQRLYQRLGVDGLQERGESFYNALIPARLAELEAAGVSTLSDGAQCVFTPGCATPLIVKKSDGGFNYASTDLAALWQRVREERADWLVYVTDSGQATHFQQVFDAARAVGWLPPSAEALPRVTHCGFGLVLGEDGKRFRTRSTETVRLADLLDEAKARSLAQLSQRAAASEGEWSEAELEAAAEAMGVAAVRYADLNANRASNYTFSFDRMLDFRGNTAVYLLYAYARLRSILRKAGEAGAGDAPPVLAAPEEAALALALCRFPEAVEAVVEELMPSRLTEYLYELSARFNEFYGACVVLGSEEQASRLALVRSTEAVMREAFRIVGIKNLLERMP